MRGDEAPLLGGDIYCAPRVRASYENNSLPASVSVSTALLFGTFTQNLLFKKTPAKSTRRLPRRLPPGGRGQHCLAKFCDLLYLGTGRNTAL